MPVHNNEDKEYTLDSSPVHYASFSHLVQFRAFNKPKHFFFSHSQKPTGFWLWVETHTLPEHMNSAQKGPERETKWEKKERIQKILFCRQKNSFQGCRNLEPIYQKGTLCLLL